MRYHPCGSGPLSEHFKSVSTICARRFRRRYPRLTTSARTASNFALEVLSKRLLSGPWAFGQSWLNLLGGLEDDAAAGSAEAVSKARTAVEQDTEDDAEQTSRQQHAERTVGAWLRPLRDEVAGPIDAITTVVEKLGVNLVARNLDPQARRNTVAKTA